MAETETLPAEKFSARLRHARISPQKVRYVADTVRGKNVNRALEILQATPRRAARFIHKLLKSAIANAESITSDRNLDIDVEELRVETLMVDGATPYKRFRSAPQGRAVPILKRTSHITLVLGPQPEEEKKEPRAKRKGEAGKEKGEAKVRAKGGAGQPHGHKHEGGAPHDHDHPHPHDHEHDHPHAHGHHHEHAHRHEPEHEHGGQHEKPKKG
jgi:large subunit ribosomal protein L22